jgi:hypothetical protein
MVRTLKQLQGDYAETEAIVLDIAKGYEVKKQKINNKGFDIKRRKINFEPLQKQKNKWEYEEVKSNTSKQTKAQKKQERQAKRKGIAYNVTHINTFDMFKIQ